MTPPRLVSCYFDPPRSEWGRMAAVLAYTAAKHCVGWDVRIVHRPLDRVPLAGGSPSFMANTHKLGYWADQVHDAADGDRILLVDADTAILRPLDALWDREFDLAYTIREQHRHPFNGGVVAVRVSDRIRRFMASWVDENRHLLNDRRYRKPWRTEFGGLNQAALGHLLAVPELGISVQTFRCAEWNCEDSAWHRFDPATTRILHVKGELRMLALCREAPTGPLAGPACAWRELDAQARRMAVSA